MVSVSELRKTWQEGFANKDSSKLAEFLTDDFQFIRPAGGARTRQETLDWTAAGGSPTSIDDLELLYENDDVAVIVHGANGVSPVTGGQGDGERWLFTQRRTAKFLSVELSDRRSKR